MQENITTTTAVDMTAVENLIDSFDDRAEESAELTEETINNVAGLIVTAKELSDGLPLLLEKAAQMKENIAGCDKNIKTWQESKKMWSARTSSFLRVLEKAMERLNVPGATLKNGKIKLATSSRTSLEVDEDWLIGLYQPVMDSLTAGLPDFIKAELKVDKNKLSAYLKTDGTLLVDHPEHIHTKVTKSTSIK